MNQIVSRRGDERAGDLNRDLERGLDWQRTIAPNERFQGFALHQLHRVVTATRLARRAELKDARDIGMPQSRGRARLAQEALPRGMRALCLCWHLDHFERDRAVQHLVPGAIGHAHRAPSKFPERTVVASLDLEIAED